MQIIIPMSGTGERFRRAGYDIPKFLIEVLGKPVIEHVIDMFPGDNEFIFICNEEHLAEPRFKLRETLLKRVPGGKIVSIAPHKRGPVFAVQQAFSLIDDTREVLLNYCDFTCLWDFSDFKTFVRETQCDGCVPAYRGFHPHMLGPTNYAFIRDSSGWLQDIQEKKPFTDNRMNEYASSGSYFFRNGEILKRYIERIIAEDIQVNGEFYASMMYRPMAGDGLRVAVYELQHFMQWGTPEDLKEFCSWSETFSSLSRNTRSAATFPGTLLMPMAGAGARFAQEGYSLPKPLIPVSGRPMVVQATSDLPKMNHQVFVLRKDLPGLESIIDTLGRSFPGCTPVVLDRLTDGQARTCLLGYQEAQVDPGQPLTIGACDNGILFDAAQFELLLAAPETDIIVWAVRGYPGAAKNPKAYGWIRESEKSVQGVSVKIPLESPATDPIILGAFTFKRAGDFVRCVEALIESGERVNGELYVDSCVNAALTLGLRCTLLEVSHYLCWGTPDDLRSFEYWQACFSQWASHPYSLESDSRIASTEREDLASRYALRPAPRPGVFPGHSAASFLPESHR